MNIINRIEEMVNYKNLYQQVNNNRIENFQREINKLIDAMSDKGFISVMEHKQLVTLK